MSETKLTLVKSDLDDWFTIERAQHANVHELRPTKYGAALFYSGRISDACVEGTADEMRGIAAAIERRSTESHKRCAVNASTDRVELWSPRNSQEHGIVSLADADELAAQIRRELPTESPGASGGTT